jgi:hypothetical protein
MTNYKKSRNQNYRCLSLAPFRIWNERSSKYQSQAKPPKNSVKKKTVKEIRREERGREWTGSPVHSLHCNNACANTRYAATSPILIRDFRKEQHELPENDKQCAIETCRSLLSVLV